MTLSGYPAIERQCPQTSVSEEGTNQLTLDFPTWINSWFILENDYYYLFFFFLFCISLLFRTKTHHIMFIFSGLSSWAVSDYSSVRVWKKLSHFLSTDSSCRSRPEFSWPISHKTTRNLQLFVSVSVHKSWWGRWCW